MKTLKISLYLLISLICTTGFAQTQSELNESASNSYKKADKELNEVYKKILFDYKEDSIFVKNLRASQRIWITFRAAELKMKYPDYGDDFYGSIQPMCVSMYLEKLTRERIKTLKAWIIGVEEGDCCSGSAKVKE